MAIEIVRFPIKKGGSFHGYVKLPEGIQFLRHHELYGAKSKRRISNASLAVLFQATIHPSFVKLQISRFRYVQGLLQYIQGSWNWKRLSSI